jgi:predicted XRE-type DNA-binding protein
VRIAGAVYVLHAFQKKSKSGRETPKADIDLIKQRLRDAEKSRARSAIMKKKDVLVGTNNIFADIGVPNAEEHLIKAQLVHKIDRLMKARKLRQVDAAKLFGVKQPDVSNMLRGDFRQFSVERLLRFLVALGQDVEIVVKPSRQPRRPAQLRVA